MQLLQHPYEYSYEYASSLRAFVCILVWYNRFQTGRDCWRSELLLSGIMLAATVQFVMTS